MESLFQRTATDFYHQLLESRRLFSQIKQIEFATQPKEVIYREDKLVLYRYQPKRKQPYATPVLIVFALINRPEILDLSPDCSFISGLLQEGRDVYLLDWGYPSPEDKTISLETYVQRYLKNCVRKVKQKSKQARLDLLGICQGGVLSLCYASLFSQDLRHLILISTPVDFQTPQDLLSRFAQGLAIEQLVAKTGNIPGIWLSQLFASLRPFDLLGKKYLSFLEMVQKDKTNAASLQQFFLMEKWLWDVPDQAGCAFAQFVKYFYQENALLQRKLRFGKKVIDLKTLRLPVLNIIGRDDYIVPPQASRILGKQIQSESYSVRILSAGHIGLYVSHKTRKRLPQLIGSWLKRMELKQMNGGVSNGRNKRAKNRGNRQRMGE